MPARSAVKKETRYPTGCSWSRVQRCYGLWAPQIVGWKHRRLSVSFSHKDLEKRTKTSRLRLQKTKVTNNHWSWLLRTNLPHLLPPYVWLCASNSRSNLWAFPNLHWAARYLSSAPCIRSPCLPVSCQQPLGEQGIWRNRGFGWTGDLEEQGIWVNRGFEGTGDLKEQGIWRNRGFGWTGDLEEQGIWRNRGFEGIGDLKEQGIWRNRGFGGILYLQTTHPPASI